MPSWWKWLVVVKNQQLSCWSEHFWICRCKNKKWCKFSVWCDKVKNIETDILLLVILILSNTSHSSFLSVCGASTYRLVTLVTGDTCHTEVRPDRPSWSGYKELNVDGQVKVDLNSLSILSVKVSLPFLCGSWWCHLWCERIIVCRRRTWSKKLSTSLNMCESGGGEHSDLTKWSGGNPTSVLWGYWIMTGAAGKSRFKCPITRTLSSCQRSTIFGRRPGGKSWFLLRGGQDRGRTSSTQTWTDFLIVHILRIDSYLCEVSDKQFFILSNYLQAGSWCHSVSAGNNEMMKK